MKWHKLGLVFCPQRNASWMVSHASNPLALACGDEVRIYFSCRDEKNRSSIGFVDINPARPNAILRVSERPLLRPGALGAFDDSGISLGCMVDTDEGRYLYYLGWNLCTTVPFRNSIGLAMSATHADDFQRASPAPVVDRSRVDPFSISYPWVMREGGTWRMWYGSNLTWGTDVPIERFVIKYAESADGVCWRRDGVISLDLEDDILALSRPCVIRDRDVYKMWYSYRRQRYRIGYAESADGITWKHMRDRVGIDVSESGWDSDTIEYPSVFDHGGNRYMLYNGNDYGRTGFGLAVLDQD